MDVQTRSAVVLSIVVALTAPALGQAGGVAKPVPLCSPSQIALTTDAGNGRFDGMSHSGTLLVLRNHAASACSLHPFASVTLQHANGGVLPPIAIEPQTAFSGTVAGGRRIPMGHGPVAPPIVLAPAETASAELTWVSGAVYDHSICVDVAAVSVAIGDGAVHAPLVAHICGPDAGHVSVALTRLVRYPRAAASGI